MAGPLLRELSRYAFSPLREGDLPLYRGRGDGLAPVLLVTAENTSVACRKRLEHEYALRAELDAAWAARPVALSRYDGRLTLVLEDPGGEPLDLQLGRPLELSKFLRIAISLAGTLRQVHERGLIHKDIKPANVLVNVASGGAWLSGFGLAAHVPRERQTPEAPEVIAGTLAYMAPEQTGRMNRSIDARSDLYSLGVTYYEMLTGTLPFSAVDPMEWVHCHIARQPTPPDERTPLPAVVSAIVMKLLAKTAEERYQTAAGVEADLRKCVVAWESGTHIELFPLATHDTPDRVLIPERLYGREHEIDALLASFEQVVSTGTPELVLVAGYSGIGKSSVVHELHKVLVPPRGLFASGKFDQYRRDIPYATLAQAFRSLVCSLLGRSEAELRRWRDSLREALGPNGQLMVDLIPELGLVIGPQARVPDLPPRDAQNRFRRVFTQFIGVFARQEHPLALFLDDLQWLDTATLDLLEHLMTHTEVRHLLLVGAYRDNEVGPAHPLMRTLEAIRKTDRRVREIVLAPLRLEDVGRLVADALHCKPGRAQPLAELLLEKTGGNPFFTIQFFSALAEAGLLAFDPGARAWQWDIDRIRAQSYSDNVVDLMAEKLKRLSATTQEALKQFACLGNVVAIDILALVRAEAEATTHAALMEALQAGLIFRLDSTYKFLHDRIQQAAYSLIPEARRAEVHLALGRALHAGLDANELEECLFDVANQLNRGVARLIERDEKVQVAVLNLRAGRKAKASTAYASAARYFSAGMALLDDRGWQSEYPLMFSLRLERAECEFLNGKFEIAEQLTGQLLTRAVSRVDQAAVYQIKILLHTVKSENPQAVASALTCLGLFGIELSAHPTGEQIRAEYAAVWQTLEGRSIESLIDLPLMTDPELQAAMQVLSVLGPPAYFTDFGAFCLIACRMVKIGMQHGISDAATLGVAILGFISGPVFQQYGEARRFARLACDLVERHRFIVNQPKVYHAAGTVAFWTAPVGGAIDFMRAASRTAIETGDLTFACFGLHQVVPGLLLRNDPLDAVWRESETALAFVREARYDDVADIIRSQQRFIATMQGRTATFATFSDAQFDEATFESQLTGDRMPLMVCFYWILKLKARYLSGNYADALAAADKVKPLLTIATAQIELLDYFYYAALTVAACYENASAAERAGWRELLGAHGEQLREWAEVFPPTFGDKHALVSAEIARLEGRDPEAMRLYEDAIRSAHDHGFVQNEALAHEVAARFYAARRFESIAQAYRRNARSCYLRWGADGKVRQLDESYPQLRDEATPQRPTSMIGASVESLDVETIVKVSQAVAREIVLEKLIDTLMRTALECAGAERGLLIVQHDGSHHIEAEALTCRDSITVQLHPARVMAMDLPDSVLHYVVRTQESVIVDDASAPNAYSADEYFGRHRVHSVLCLPLIKQANVIGVLYLENNLAPRVFTPARNAVLKVLAAQAAIALENAYLYTDLRQENNERRRAEDALRRSEAYLAQAQNLSHTGSFGWNTWSDEFYWSAETCRIYEFDAASPPTLQRAVERAHPEDRAFLERALDHAQRERKDFDLEHRLLMPDGSVKHLHVLARAQADACGNPEFVGAVMDVTQRRRAEEAQRVAQADLMHVTRLTTMGELAASIAHEVNQPLASMVTNAESCLHWLAKEPANLDRARGGAERIIRDGHHARDVIRSLRALARKTAPEMRSLDIKDVIQEALELLRGELHRHAAALETSFLEGLPHVVADRVQLQQVVVNLVMNGIQAMSAVTGLPRLLRVTSRLDADDMVRIAVADLGIGLDPDRSDRIFDPMFTTKRDGLGMGLSICRSIIDAHGGRLWAAANTPCGAVFQFTLPVAR